jgi:metabolite-proton symporter
MYKLRWILSKISYHALYSFLNIPIMSQSANSKTTVLFASLAGTTIEFFDFYIYANAAILVFPHLFFPESTPATQMLQSLATFAVAFFARPLGSAFFGHYGDKIGRKATLVAALLTMGLSTLMIGFLPSYHSVGIIAPMLLVLCRFGQGFGLGGEWGGAVLLAVENAPQGQRAWYGMFPQLGAPLGLLMSGGIFLYLTETLPGEDFLNFGWRIPFIASSILIALGLYVRLKITETPEFTQASMTENLQQNIPMNKLFKSQKKSLLLATFTGVATFGIFYLMTVFIAGWSIQHFKLTEDDFLILQLYSIFFFAIMIPISAVIADKFSASKMMIFSSLFITIFGLFLEYFMNIDGFGVLITLCLGMTLMGLTYGPLGTLLSSMFPITVRYTGASLSFNLAGILGASFAPFIAMWLANNYGFNFVGYYLSVMGFISMIAAYFGQTRKI